ncbi:MAG: hypothetical protein KJ957_07950 [Candidatus Omnitrophica bacterium]|nr:hypothetical protein [Candidatus Omnitrophota bacterium]
MKKRGLLIKLLLGSPVLAALIAGIFSISRRPNTPSQTIDGDQSNAINIQGLQNTNINIDYANRPKLAMDKIMFGERYAYEFNNYLGSANEPGNMSRIIEQNAILQKRYNANENVRLTPAIINFNEGIPLKQARIQLVFSQGVVIEDTQRWAVQEVNGRYSWKFNESINNTGLNTDSIFVKFPKPGQYRLMALIDGENLKGIKEVDYFIELYE